MDEFILTDEDIQFDYRPFDIIGHTDYHPIQSILGEDFEFVQHVRSTTSVYDSILDEEVKVPMMHVKFSPLLDPIRYVTGKYNLQDPDIRVIATKAQPNTPFAKLGSPNNAAYVDSLFCYLSNQLVHKYGFANGIKCYGITSGVQSKYKMNIGNDLEFIEDSRFFRANIGLDDSDKAWFLVPQSSMDVLGHNPVPNNQLPRIQIDDSEDIQLDEIEDLDEMEDLAEPQQPPVSDTESEIQENVQLEILNQESMEIKSNTSQRTDISSRISISSNEDDDENEEEDEEDVWSTEDEEEEESENVFDEEEEQEEDLFMYVRDFPVQMIFMERFDGTLDQLILRDELTEELHFSSALMQVVMTLLAYRRAYNFTHNDLHTSNIMYKTTNEEYLYYIFDGKTYKVPTFGRIFTIIDFGRAIYEYKGHRFCSDSFSIDGDAYTQYNTEPFFNHYKPRIDPNPGFDLCRLGCSLYDLAMDGLYDTCDLNEYQKTVFRWCQDDYERNILYKRNGNERYPNFKSYKMIARTSHAHTPEAQLKFPFFNQWLIDNDIDAGVAVFNIDTINSC